MCCARVNLDALVQNGHSKAKTRKFRKLPESLCAIIGMFRMPVDEFQDALMGSQRAENITICGEFLGAAYCCIFGGLDCTANFVLSGGCLCFHS